MDATTKHILVGLTVALTGVATPLAATAQEAGYLSEFERPYGFSYGAEERPFDAGTRDINGNRVVVNGLINGGTGLGFGMNTGWGQTDGASGMLGTGTAVGNQLNVITNGSNNTIIIDATQINNGDQNVVLNGELNLDE
ncbi:MAG: holdfast anchoring protein HfaA [Hyphomonadaceae bacterium]|nr:holdfast anchoring protein HfaA [Hyphomonadaceae bacterium]